MAPDSDACRLRRGRQPWASVHAAARGMQLSERGLEHQVALMTGTGLSLPFAPGIIAAATDFQYTAEDREGIYRVLRVDKPEGHVDSLAKNAVAFFKISRSMRRI